MAHPRYNRSPPRHQPGVWRILKSMRTKTPDLIQNYPDKSLWMEVNPKIHPSLLRCLSSERKFIHILHQRNYSLRLPSLKRDKGCLRATAKVCLTLVPMLQQVGSFLFACPDGVSHNLGDPPIFTAGPPRLGNNHTVSPSPLKRLRNGNPSCVGQITRPLLTVNISLSDFVCRCKVHSSEETWT